MTPLHKWYDSLAGVDFKCPIGLAESISGTNPGCCMCEVCNIELK